MKKVILLFLLLFTAIPSFGDVFFEPEWEDFCPKRYSDISMTRWHYTKSGRYWSDRRKGFESRLEKCKSLPVESQKACFDELRVIESEKSRYRINQEQTNALNRIFINKMF